MSPDSGPYDAVPDGDDRFHRCVIGYLEQTLDRAELNWFERELVSSDARRREFMLICFGDSLARERLAGETSTGEPSLRADEVAADAGDPLQSLHETMVLPALEAAPHSPDASVPAPPAAPTPDPHPLWNRVGGKRAAAAAVAAGLLLVGAVSARYFFGGADARLVDAVDARWRETQPVPTAGRALPTGQWLTLSEGFVGVAFDDGANAIVEAPARFRVESGSSLRLTSGKLSVRMPPGRGGFEVKTPLGVVTDLGTEFGVRIGAAGQEDVQVFVGRVSVAVPSAGPAQVVRAGDGARVGSTGVRVVAGGAVPQDFVRDLHPTVASLDLVDLVCGGDGTGDRRGWAVDPVTGTFGRLPAGTDRLVTPGFRPVPSLAIADGTFNPDPTGRPTTLDSAGHTFTFPANNGHTYLNILAGGQVPVPAGMDKISTSLGGTNYDSRGHGFLLVHPNSGLTLDLAAVRRLHPGTKLTEFHGVLGNSHPRSLGARCDAFVLVDGALRTERRRFTPSDGPQSFSVTLSDSDRFLTLAATDGGDGTSADDVLFADPAFDTAR